MSDKQQDKSTISGNLHFFFAVGICYQKTSNEHTVGHQHLKKTELKHDKLLYMLK